MPHARPRPTSWPAAIARATGSLLALIALLAGPPLLLLRWGSLPKQMPTLSGIGHALVSPDDGTVLFTVLTVAAWLFWLGITTAIVVEAVGLLRRQAVRRLRLLSGPQHLAAMLLGGLLLTSPAAAVAATPAQATTVTATATPGAHTSVPTTAPLAEQSGPTHVVTPTGETLWDLAVQYLGNGLRWKEIADLNPGLPDTASLPAGTVLTLPADAKPAAPDTGTHTDGGRAPLPVEHDEPTSYTVVAGDTLSHIAQSELGDADKYTELFDLNKGEPLPGGGHFTDPDLIVPGQHLTLHTPHATAPQQDDDGEHHARVSGNHDNVPIASPHHDPTSAATPSTHEPASPTSAPQTPSATATPSASPAPGTAQQHTPTPASAASAQAVSDTDSTVDKGAWAGGIAALLAAGLLGSLGVKRILQQRRRKAGETIAIDPDPTLVEQVLHASAEPFSVTRLDLALRTLAHHATTSGHDLPTVRGAQVTDRTVHLLLDDPAATPMPPFVAGPREGWWALDPAAPLLEADEARDVLAPYPGLLTLGATDAGHLLLANLLHSRALLLDGDAEDVLAVARAMTLEAGTCGWSDHTEIITVGLGTRLATLLPKGRIRTMPHLPAVVSDLGALLVEVHQHTEGPEPLPWTLICATDVDPEQAWQLADAVSAAHALPVSVVLPASDATRSLWPDADTIPVAAGATVTLDHLGGEPITLQRLEDEQYRQYVHALEVAEEPAQPAGGAWQLAADHDYPATTPPPEPVPLLLQSVDGDDADPGDPFPALLASAQNSIRLVKPTPPSGQEVEHSDEQPAEQASVAADAIPAVTSENAGPTMPVAAEAADEGGDPAPEINVLGPIEATGISGSGHGPKVAALAALILLRPGRSADTLCTSMDPLSPWSTRTLQSRLSEIRSRFGTDPHGNPYLPRPRGGYTFAAGVRSDWDRFQRLATRALAVGPEGGIADLETALALVRGRPFDGADYPWADALQQEMISRIVDVAHTVAAWHSQAATPDLDAARRAVLSGLDIDETAEVLYRDWLLIEHTAGNHQGVRKVVARVQHVTRAYDIDMDPRTERIIAEVLGERPSPAQASRL